VITITATALPELLLAYLCPLLSVLHEILLACDELEVDSSKLQESIVSLGEEQSETKLTSGVQGQCSGVCHS
jgi:hypothetical protein